MPNLHKHQKQVASSAPNRYGLWLKMGVGKTAVALELAKSKGEIPLIVCPKSLKENWYRECKMWGVEDHIIMTKEEFRRDWDKLRECNFIIFDEYHYQLGIKSQMYKNSVAFLSKHQPEYIYALTATPFLSTPWNVYCAEKLLGHMPSYKYYKETFFNRVPMGFMTLKSGKKVRRMIDVPNKKNYHLLVKRLNEIGITMTMAEVVDVPEYTFIREDFELNTEQKIAISELTDTVPIAYYTRAFQIENGTLKSDGYGEDLYFKSEKFNRTLELIRDNEKLIVVCHHNLEIERFKKEIKDKNVLTITGQTKGKDRQGIIDFANASGNCVLIINAAICEGLNLPTFQLIVFYSMSWSITHREQMEGRNQRIVDLRKNTYIDMVVGGGVDEAVYDCIKEKKSFSAEIYAKENKI